jgi:signal transduction histidine kinase
LLGQVVDILLDNAIIYCTLGSAVLLSSRVEGGRVLLVVEDAGCGIDPEDLPHAFEPFFRSPRQ